ncbi:MAG TPA: Ig-like domain-containing protein, partial [Acidimicrobiales bacterium]|nr:Ig-like domain-containing protein [Acidimicrobiales bacterium]
LAAPGATATGWSFDWSATGAGSYTATATAVDASANADASPATVTFSSYVPDTTPADTTVTSPSNGDSVPVGGGTAGGATAGGATNGGITFSGVASDDTGVAAVKVAVKNDATGQWWRADGTWGSYQAHSATLSAAGATSTGWSFDWSPTGAGSYSVTAAAVDSSGNVDTSPATVTFSSYVADTIAPDSRISSPLPGTTVRKGDIVFRGTATDNVAVQAVRIGIRDADSGLWLQADGTWAAGYASYTATLASADSASTTWQLTARLMGKGSYSIRVVASDATSNTDASPAWSTFKVVVR